MKKRRLHITEEEGDTILLALVAGIQEVNKILEKENTIYWRFLLERMEKLKTKIQEYKWYTE